MDEPDDLPRDEQLLAELLDVEQLEHDGRTFVVARISLHPTAYRAVLELSDEGDPEPRAPSELVTESSDPWFWVEQYGNMLHDYIEEVRERLNTLVGHETEPETRSGPVGKAFEPGSPVGKAARQSAVGVRALTASFAEVLFHASAAQGWPDDTQECARFLELFIDASMAASILEQLSGQAAIPDDVRDAWEPENPDD